jgi:hypothetical protein
VVRLRFPPSEPFYTGQENHEDDEGIGPRYRLFDGIEADLLQVITSDHGKSFLN